MDFEYRGRRPEDAFMSWVWHHPRVALAVAFGIMSGIPALVGFLMGLAL
ncbi:hypothetical protein CcrColossus_gp046 [Caulobacter phage CcrColossus]|uniref:Uncharacterized protein n=1 Tax=Caulobacter phage CcrColossus TaxID=1211640 RepID=K4JS49_9CAUD|nr:hypothetical protein CcrColossus_gp046 [Caulobacter phage CcrColossus]AFU87916.1 hypothetical protein CcrColossus_gp046 [Caulobacter phage CcrColossus]